MLRIIGVRFRNAGKVYYFDPKTYKIRSGDHVIVETARGVEYGTVVGGIREIAEDKVVQPLKAVLRVATPEDDARAERNRAREREALRICGEKIRKRNLDMKLIDAEYTFDNNKLLFYFTADGRIDFRELVKDLAAVFKMRIELRQIGVRDETKILGGIGICGRVLCCNSYLSDFIPVSIKMAKEQNLSLNPTKISGACGRLMCCLKNEEDTYEYLNSKLPGIGDTVTTPDGSISGEVQSVNVLRQRVKVLVDVGDEKELREYPVDELSFRPRRRKEKTGKGDRGEKSDRADKSDRSDHAERGDRSEKNDRADKGDRGERSDRADKGDRGERSDRADKGDRGERSDRADKGDRGEKNDRADRSDRSEKNGRSDREDRPEKGRRGDRGGRYERGEKKSKQDKPDEV